MTTDGPIEILCRYRLKPGTEDQFVELLKVHWRTLADLRLTSDRPSRIKRASDHAGNVAYIERFAWANASAVDSAHQSPDVMKGWEPMGALCDDMEFWNVEDFKG